MEVFYLVISFNIVNIIQSRIANSDGFVVKDSKPIIIRPYKVTSLAII